MRPSREHKSPAKVSHPHPLRQASVSLPASTNTNAAPPPPNPNALGLGLGSGPDPDSNPGPDPGVGPSTITSTDLSQRPAFKADVQSTESGQSGQSGGSLITDAQKWFDSANNNPKPNNTIYDDDSPYFLKRDSSGDEIANNDPLMSPQRPPPSVPGGAAFMPPGIGPLAMGTPHSSSAEDYRSVIDDLTIENKRLKEELKRYRQGLNRDVLEKDKLFEIKVHGLPRRKKQELEATLRDFAASLGDSPSSDSASQQQRKRDKQLSVSSKERSSNHHHHHHHSHHNHGHGHSHSHNTHTPHSHGQRHGHAHGHAHSKPDPYSSNGSRSKHASNSSSWSRPVDSAYASMSTGAQSSDPSLSRQPFGGSKARASSEQKVERYLQDIPQGLHPNYGMRSLSDKEKKRLIVRRLEQLFTGRIGGRFAHPSHSATIAEESSSSTQQQQQQQQQQPASASAGGGPEAAAGASSTIPPKTSLTPLAVQAIKAGKSLGGNGGRGSRDGGGGGGSVSVPASAATAPPAIATGVTATTATPGKAPAATQPAAASDSISSEPLREARIQTRHAGHKQPGSQDNASASQSNGEDTAVAGKEKSPGSGSGNATGHSGGSGGKHKSSPGSTALPEQRPTRPLDLDPDRVQVPAENMAYIRHLGLVPPEIGPKSVATTVDVSPDANGWVYLNLLANLAQLHIFHVAPDFIRQAVVEKSTKFQLSPDGQKIRWRGGADGTKFSSDSSNGNASQPSLSTDDSGASDENGGKRKRSKPSSGSVTSSSKKRSQQQQQHHLLAGQHPYTSGGTSSIVQYKPLFVRQTSSPRQTSGEDSSTQMSDAPDVSAGGGGGGRGGNNNVRGGGSQSISMSNSNSNSNNNNNNNNSNSNNATARYASEMSRSGSSSTRHQQQQQPRHKSDGVVVYYSGMPFCTDLAGDSGGEASPTTYTSSPGQLDDDSVDEVLQGRPTIHRSTSGSLIPFRPLTDYLSLSRDEWAGLGLLGIGTVGRGSGTGASGGGAAGGSGNSGGGNGDNMSSSSASYISSASTDNVPDDDIFMLNAPATATAASHAQLLLEGASSSSSSASPSSSPPMVESKEPVLEASGISGVTPDDHFSVRVTTQRPFRKANAIEYDEDTAGDVEGAGTNAVPSNTNSCVFSMSSLAQRVAALKKQTAPISAAVPTLQPPQPQQTPPVVVQYMSVAYSQREPVRLPPPAMFYPPFSQSSESDESEDLLDSEVVDEEDSSMFSTSSVISRRANPHHSVHHSVNNPSLVLSGNPSVINASELMLSSGEDGDVEAGEDMAMEDSA